MNVFIRMYMIIVFCCCISIGNAVAKNRMLPPSSSKQTVSLQGPIHDKLDYIKNKYAKMQVTADSIERITDVENIFYEYVGEKVELLNRVYYDFYGLVGGNHFKLRVIFSIVNHDGQERLVINILEMFRRKDEKATADQLQQKIYTSDILLFLVKNYLRSLPYKKMAFYSRPPLILQNHILNMQPILDIISEEDLASSSCQEKGIKSLEGFRDSRSDNIKFTINFLKDYHQLMREMYMILNKGFGIREVLYKMQDKEALPSDQGLIFETTSW